MISVEETLETYDLFDNSILRHGFTAYLRDYEIVAKTFHGEDQGVYTYLFRGCVEAHYESSIPEGAFLMDYSLVLESRNLRVSPSAFGGLSTAQRFTLAGRMLQVPSAHSIGPRRSVCRCTRS